MKKLYLLSTIFLLFLIVSCSKEQIYTVKYICTEGGKIIGEQVQEVKQGAKTSEITLEIEKGYYFDCWDDGLLELNRSEKNVQSNMTFTAKIKKICTINYIINMEEAGIISGELSQTISDRNGSTQVYARPKPGFKFIKWSDGVTSQFRKGDKFDEDVTIKAIFEYTKYDIPVITINTNNVPIVSKDEYVSMNLSISNTEEEYLLSNVTGKIKGRGNSTWDMPKKPFKIKFDKKQKLFDSAAEKSWTLIANYCDKSLIRNYLAYELSDLCSGIEYTTTHELVEVVLNNEYLGVYLLCDQIEVKPSRVSIETESAEVDTGYLVELDNRAPSEGKENVDYFYSYGFPYGIKSPETDAEYYSVNQLKYIQQYLDKAMDVIINKNFNEIKKYIDIDSFVDSYIIQELFKNCDVGFSSFYLYKDKGGVLFAGPLWDFDISTGNCDYSDVDTPLYYRTRNVNIWYKNLMNVSEFYSLVANRYRELQPEIEKIILEGNEILTTYRNAFERNFERWQIMGIYVWPNTQEIVNLKTIDEQINYLSNWLSTRNQWLLGALK